MEKKKKKKCVYIFVITILFLLFLIVSYNLWLIESSSSIVMEPSIVRDFESSIDKLEPVNLNYGDAIPVIYKVCYSLFGNNPGFTTFNYLKDSLSVILPKGDSGMLLCFQLNIIKEEFIFMGNFTHEQYVILQELESSKVVIIIEESPLHRDLNLLLTPEELSFFLEGLKGLNQNGTVVYSVVDTIAMSDKAIILNDIIHRATVQNHIIYLIQQIMLLGIWERFLPEVSDSFFWNIAGELEFMLNEASTTMHTILDAMETKKDISTRDISFIEDNRESITILHTQVVFEDLSVSLMDQERCDLLVAKDEYVLNMHDQVYLYKIIYNYDMYKESIVEVSSKVIKRH